MTIPKNLAPLYKRATTQDSHDPRDLKFAQLKQSPTKNKVDLRHNIYSPVIDQGLLNSCSACALSVAFEMSLKNSKRFFDNQSLDKVNPSEMFIYYHERVYQGNVNINGPVEIRNGIKAIAIHGVCSEELWPYAEIPLPEGLEEMIAAGENEEAMQMVQQALEKHDAEIQNIVSTTPTPSAIEQASLFRATNYYSLSVDEGVEELKASLSKGIPVVFGIMEPESFFGTPESGIMPMPSDDEPRIGGHAMIAVGFDDEKQIFIVRNSYGEEFGDRGYCYMPYEFITGSYLENSKPVRNTFSFWCLLAG